MKRIRNLVLSFLLLCAVIFVPFVSDTNSGMQTAAAAEESTTDYSTKYVVLSLEGFTLGQGFYITPERMSYQEIGNVWKQEGVELDLSKLTVSQATYAFFKQAGLETTPSDTGSFNSSDFYLSNIKGIDTGVVNVPQELKDAYNRKHKEELTLESKTGTDLGEFDYTTMSGWMNTVDNVLGDTGAGSYPVDTVSGDADTHVIRWQFTLADYGGDLGYGMSDDGAYYVTQDKTELYTLYAEHADEIEKDTALKEELLSVMADFDATADEVEQAEKQITGMEKSSVSITMNNQAPYMTLTDADGNEVELGEPENYTYTAGLSAGTYRLSAYKMSGSDKVDMGSIDLVVTEEKEQSYSLLSATGIYCSSYDTVDGERKYWTEGTDYEMTCKVVSQNSADRHAVPGLMKAATETSYAQYAALCYKGDTVSVTFSPIGDRLDGYMEKTVSATLTANRSYGFSAAIPVARKVSVTVPAGAELRLGTLSTYYIYQDLDGVQTESTEAGYDTYEYKAANGTMYYYRVSCDGGVTYWNWFSTTKDAEYTVTKEDMFIGSSTYRADTVIHDFSENKYDVADIYMTTNEKGYLSLEKGESYKMESFRNWQAIEGISNAKTAEPDFHYTVIDENGNPSNNVIQVTSGSHSEAAEIKAVSEGTAILLVTYDAQINKVGMGGSFYSAIWPENTGVVVVTVGKDGSSIETNMTINQGMNNTGAKTAGDAIDAQLDVLYYPEGSDGAEYTFAPESGVSVSVLRPNLAGGTLTYDGFSAKDITRNADGSYTIAGLTEGPNVVKVTKNGVSTYQVIRAKEVAVSYIYKDADGNEIAAEELSAGDTIEITYGERSSDGSLAYDGVYIPANKFAGIYNMSGSIKLTDADGTVYAGTGNQYLFASTPACQKVTVTIPEYYANDTFTLRGYLYEGGYGSPYGSHRAVSHVTGKPADFTAKSYVGSFGVLPEQEFKLAATDFVDVILKVTDSKTQEKIDDYTITVVDEAKKETTVTDGSFKGYTGKTYTYTIYCAGYMYKTGSFEIPDDTDSITKTIRLTASGETVWDGISASEPELVDGVYQVGTGAELYWLACEVNKSGAQKDADVVLTTDINLAGYPWTPIGTSSYVYTGTFDGNGHTIQNLYVNDAAYAGLFGMAKGKICNLTVDGDIFLKTKTSSGAIVGYLNMGTADAPAEISNCISYVDITYTGTSTSANIGGIAGYAYASSASNTVIKDCMNYGAIKAENGGNVGGILGDMISHNITIKNCTNYGEVSANQKAGGILGNYSAGYRPSPAPEITGCYNAGTITANQYAGGIAGYYKGDTADSEIAKITDCYSAGTVVDGSTPAEETVFAGYSESVTIAESVYSNTDAASGGISEDEAVYVSGSALADVKKLTAETVEKSEHAEILAAVEPAVASMEGKQLSDADKAFVNLYQTLKEAVDAQKTVKVGVYDYTAVAAGIDGASETGVILDDAEVNAATALEAIEKIFKENDIDYVLDTSWGSAYFSSINGLSVTAEYSMSGWSFSYNDDDFSNMGVSAIEIEDGDVLEFHYALTGSDVAASYSGLPTFKTLTIGGSKVSFAVETTYDANWNAQYTYKANGEVLEGDGTQENPFLVNVNLFQDSDLSNVAVSYETEADAHYVTVNGLSDNLDLTNGVTCSIASKGGRNAWYTITAAADAEKVISEDNTEVVVEAVSYTGEAVEPKVSVYVNHNLLDSDAYDITYENNVNAGTGSCTIAGKGAFTGSVQKTFEIKKAEQTIANVPEDTTVVYGVDAVIEIAPKAQTVPVIHSGNEAVVTVNDDGNLQINGIGTAEVTITAPEGDNYLEKTETFVVTVTGDISKAVCDKIDAQTYTGEAIVPELTLIYAGNNLVKDTDYVVACSKNINAGTAKVEIKGKGFYFGTLTTEFEIKKAAQTIAVSSAGIEVTEGAEPFALQADGKGTLTFVSSAPAVAEVDAETGLVTVKAAGFTDITITSNGTANYEAAETTVRVTVKKKETGSPDNPTEDSSEKTTEETPDKTTEETPGNTTETPSAVTVLTAKNTSVKVADVTYTGKVRKPAVTVTAGGKVLTKADYTVSYSNNKNAGMATVTVTGKGSYSGSVKQNFTIKKAAQKVGGQTIYAYNTYLTVKASAKGKVTYTSSNKKVAVVNKKTGFIKTKKPGKVKIKVTAAATANYKKGSGVITIVVVPKQTTVQSLKASGTKAFKISYKKSSGASGYQITYSTNKNFKSAKSKYVSGKKTSAVVKKLKKGKKYYVKVRAYKTINGKKYYGIYSKVKTIRVK